VVVVTGDGELLMGLGSLATIGAHRTPNLSIVVLDNEHYGETGMQASHTALGTDLAGIAAAAGLASTTTIYTAEELAAWIPTVYSAQGPLLGVVKVLARQPALQVPARDGTYLKARFREALLGAKAFE
jgi:thiamine pyrophosphate-dependent acetolactate synthase large subunit-like protein